jgi:hypothetical protein
MKYVSSFVLFLAMAVSLSNCSYAQGRISGEGDVVSKTLDVDPFTAIALAVNADVYITKGSQSVEVEGQANIIDNLELDVKKNTWNIEFKEKARKYKKLKITISMPDLSGLAIAGSGAIRTQDNFDMKTFKASIAGSGDIICKGTAEEVNASIAGSGDLKLSEVEAVNVEVSIAGSGDALVHATENLKVSIAGSGDVRYKGNPRLKSSVAGSGSINSLSE